MPLPRTPPELTRLPPEDDLRRRVKRELRKRVQGLRKATPLDACRERSRGIVQSLGDLAGIRSARSVALFWPIEEKHEVDLRALDLALRERGARVAYPALERGASPDERTGRMTFHFVDDPKELAERGCGFSEPPPGTPALASDLHELDVVVVPALALDPGRPAHRIRRRLLRPRARARPHPEGRRHLRLPARERDTRDGWRCRSRLDCDRPPRAPGRAARRALRAVDGGDAVGAPAGWLTDSGLRARLAAGPAERADAVHLVLVAPQLEAVARGDLFLEPLDLAAPRTP